MLQEGSELLLEQLYVWNTAFYAYLNNVPSDKSSTTPLSWSSLTANKAIKSHAFISTPSEYLVTVRAMLKHDSQMVWFRWLNLVSSKCMWMGELEEVGGEKM